jgi:hypothetical protein
VSSAEIRFAMICVLDYALGYVDKEALNRLPETRKFKMSFSRLWQRMVPGLKLTDWPESIYARSSGVNDRAACQLDLRSGEYPYNARKYLTFDQSRGH